MTMVQALILDIDGVIVGDKQGFNFPHPHPAVIDALKAVRSQGIPITLCTAKPAFAVGQIIAEAGLANPHITDGGAVITDPVDDVILSQHVIPRVTTQAIAAFARKHGLYLEIYTSDSCYILRDQRSDFTNKHAEVEHRMPTFLDAFEPFLAEHNLVKMFLLTNDDASKQAVSDTFTAQFGDLVTFGWTAHPALPSFHFGVVTARGVSKAHGAEETAKNTGVDLANTLGVGDTLHDWQFMKLCGYAAAMGNATDELKAKVSGLGDHGYIGPGVNDNGIIDILQHFGLANE